MWLVCHEQAWMSVNCHPVLISLPAPLAITSALQVYTVQLYNPHQVPAEWSIKRPAVDSPKLRDWPFFVAEPCEGVMEPGARTNIRVTFTPQVRVHPFADRGRGRRFTMV